MNISPAQTALEASTESLANAKRSAPVSTPPADGPGGSSSASSQPSPPPQHLTTDLRFDDQHQPYYEFVDDRSQEVLFEIPPEALRELAESLKVPLVGSSPGCGIDVKS
jgi:hypothetical protein